MVCRRNIAAPPSLNLAGEVMLLIGILGRGGVWGVFLGLLSFLAGAYSLYLYVGTQHGAVGGFYGRFLAVKVRRFFMVLCHWLPLNVFFMCLGLLRDWVYYIISLCIKF